MVMLKRGVSSSPLDVMEAMELYCFQKCRWQTLQQLCPCSKAEHSLGEIQYVAVKNGSLVGADVTDTLDDGCCWLILELEVQYEQEAVQVPTW